jgi:hypothetical protein
MKKLFLYLLPLALLAACSPDGTQEPGQEGENAVHPAKRLPAEKSGEGSTLEVVTSDNPTLSHENLRIYPILASDAFVAANDAVANLKNLKEGMETKGFYVTEKKPFGRFEDEGAVNNLTIQNKSQDTIYMMQGDVVRGGNQDRILAQDMIVPPRTITNIPVYCVEKGRWQYRQEDIKEDDQEAEHKRKIYAFSGYYNVASSELRKTVRETRDQQSVWNKVGELTSKNNAKTSTGTYTGLENSKEFTERRDAYLAFFKGKLDEIDNCVGFVAVSGNKVVGCDVFGHPNLLIKQYEALMHGYVTDAVSNGQVVNFNKKQIESFAKKLDRNFKAAMIDRSGNKDIYIYEGQIVHYSSL